MGRASRKNTGGGGSGGALRESSSPAARTSARDIEETPWGEAQRVETLAPGFYWVDTAGHGGIMIERGVGDAILSPSEQEKGLAGNPLSSRWYVFEQDVDWAQAANAFARIGYDVEADKLGSADLRRVPLPPSEIMPGDIVYPPGGHNAENDGAMIVDTIEEREDGTYLREGSGGYLVPSGETVETERRVVPGYEPDFGASSEPLPPSDPIREPLPDSTKVQTMNRDEMGRRETVEVSHPVVVAVVEAMRENPGSTAMELSEASGQSYEEVMESVRVLREAEVGVFEFGGLGDSEFSLDEDAPPKKSAMSDAEMQNHVDDMDRAFPPEEPPREVLEKMEKEILRDRAEERAQDDADDDGIDWDSLSSSEQEKRIEKAGETISSEDLDRVEEIADNWGQ